jgi:hypothetical protein
MLAGRKRLALVGGLVFLFIGLVAVLGLVPFAQAAPARDVAAASVVNVTTTDDETTSGDGVCSLREAVEGRSGCAGQTVYLSPTTYVLTDTSAHYLNIAPATNLDIAVAGSGHAIIEGAPGWNDRILKVQTAITTVVVTISNVTIQGGQASDLSLAGGGVYNISKLALIDCQIFSNTASLGGGIFNAGTLWLTNTVVISNAASLGFNQGGGIYNASFLSLYNSAVISNTAQDAGGGIFGDGTGDDTLLKNVTISGNRAERAGGGIFGGAKTNLNYTTVYGNVSLSGAGIYDLGHNDVIANSIVGGNTGGDCVGPWQSAGYNLAPSDCSLGAPTDVTTDDPLLGPLQDNGGSTLTHALAGGSPALDRIPAGASGCGSAVKFDQRGVARPHGNGCDIGAYEFGVALNPMVYLPLLLR